MDIKIPYGLKEDRLIYISEVESGLACECICPACDSKLVARKGAKREHHFAHYKKVECKGAFETTLHFFAKEVIEQEGKFTYPSLTREVGIFGPQLLFEEGEIVIENIEAEKRFEDIVPDLILKVRDKQLFIEIAVSHFIDELKREKIISYGISTIEIDLSNEVRVFDPEVIKQKVVYGAELKTWIFNNKEDRLKTALQEKLLEEARQKMLQDGNQGIDSIFDFDDGLENEGFSPMNNDQSLDTFDRLKYVKLFCPKRSVEVAQEIVSKEPLVDKLAEGSRWNGIFYGRKPNGRYLYINNEQFWVYPSADVKSSPNDRKIQNRLYAQLREVQREATIQAKDCESCPFLSREYKWDAHCKYAKQSISSLMI